MMSASALVSVGAAGGGGWKETVLKSFAAQLGIADSG
jgi:hypothetical protein